MNKFPTIIFLALNFSGFTALPVLAAEENLVMCVAAQSAKRQKDYDRAYTLYSRCIEYGELNKRNLVVALNNRGNLMLNRSNYNQAIADFDQALKIDDNYAKALNNRGMAYQQKGFFREAVRDFSAALENKTDFVDAQNNLAWLKATSPVESARDANGAVNLAIALNTNSGWQDHSHLDTLAAAYAAAGDFEQAVKYQTKAIELTSAKQTQEYNKRLELYQQQKPYRDPL